MTTQQPKWKRIANLGDINPIEYGGAFVYVDRTNTYSPELEILEPSEEGEEQSWTVRRWPINRCTFQGGVLSDNTYHPQLPAWFADKIGDVAQYTGMTELAMITALCSADPVERAVAYEAIADYFGADNFDMYPRMYYTRTALPYRFRR